ncbi:MAG: PadR family transcriptional regulator [Planctomycetota bacterium]
MTVKNSLLAILAQEPTHGYGLKSTFERSTAGTWPLNIGQVYQTLSRLERDGLVAARPADDSARQTWQITEAGRDALNDWYREPVIADPPVRDELAIKVLLAIAADKVDVSDILQTQRTATMERIQELTRHKRKADPESELPWLLMIEALVLKAEAEVKWLDLCEARLAGGAS